MKKINYNKTAIIAVTNDLTSDHRVHKTCLFLKEKGFNVLLIGRKFRHSLPLTRPYQTHRMRLFFNKKFFFYAEYNFRLFLFLLFHKTHLIVSNDLDTLLACFIASRIKRIPILYDSHEYFTEVPELVNRNKVKKIWQKIESFIIPKLPFAITVNNSLANIYTEKYKIPFISIRNVPENPRYNNDKLETKIPFNSEITHILLYQGSLNVGRGIEILIESLHYLEPKFGLLIIGTGDIEKKLKQLVFQKNLQSRVFFTGKIPFDSLYQYTTKAFLGFSIEENIGLNYYYALPNKLFDYIHAGVPVICSNFPEMKYIVDTYQVGLTVKSPNATLLAKIINNISNDRVLYQTWKKNCKIAASELTWEKEKNKLEECFIKLGFD